MDVAQAGEGTHSMAISARDITASTSIMVQPGENLLQAIERHDPHSATVGCRNGGCGVCRVHLHSGQARLGKMSRRYVTMDMERARFALACRVYPESDIQYRLAPLDRPPF